MLAKRSRCGVWIPGYGGRPGSGWPGLKAPISVDGRQSEKSGRSEVSPPGGQRPAGVEAEAMAVELDEPVHVNVEDLRNPSGGPEFSNSKL